MKTHDEIKAHLAELVEHYTGPEFKGLCMAEQGYHLVRAIDESVAAGLFEPSRPMVNFHAKGPDEIVIEIMGYSCVPHVIALKAKK